VQKYCHPTAERKKAAMARYDLVLKQAAKKVERESKARRH
jgi:hypothetical protein